MASIIQVRRDTAANWTSANPTLAQGEIGFETDTLKLKIGNGTTAWNSLAYYTTVGGALVLDQTTPQTVINGQPILQEGIKVGKNPSSSSTLSSFATPPTTAARVDGNYSVGFAFKVAHVIKVSQLGRLYVSGNSQNHLIKLWNSSAALLTSGTVLAASTSDANGFKWVSVTEVTLYPGSFYYIAIDEYSGGDAWKDVWVANTSVQTDFTDLNAMWYPALGTFPSNPASPANDRMHTTPAMKYYKPYQIDVDGKATLDELTLLPIVSAEILATDANGKVKAGDATRLIPAGGTTADTLVKKSSDDYDVAWAKQIGSNAGCCINNNDSGSVVAMTLTGVHGGLSTAGQIFGKITYEADNWYLKLYSDSARTGLIAYAAIGGGDGTYNLTPNSYVGGTVVMSVDDMVIDEIFDVYVIWKYGDTFNQISNVQLRDHGVFTNFGIFSSSDAGDFALYGTTWGTGLLGYAGFVPESTASFNSLVGYFYWNNSEFYPDSSLILTTELPS